MVQRSLSTNLSKNTALFHALLPLDDSFDLITRDLKLGNTPAYWIGVNGFCKTEILQQIFSDLQDPLYTLDSEIRDLPRYVQSKLGYAQVSLTSSIDTILQNILSGPSVLLVEGFAQAVIIDVRTYPVRSISEPDTERITRGARDGFVETLLFNTNLIRLTAKLQQVLHRENSIFCNGSQTCADKIPAHTGSIRVHITAHFVLVLLIGMLIPAAGSVVVVSSGVTDTVTGAQLMRQEGTFAGSIKSKLQDLHTWKTKGVAELFHFWCNDAQIFCLQ